MSMVNPDLLGQVVYVAWKRNRYTDLTRVKIQTGRKMGAPVEGIFPISAGLY